MLNKILQQIGHSPTKQTAKSWQYKSPFNPNERTPSFFVFTNSTTGEFTNFKDYSDGTGGDIYKFLMSYYNINFVEAKQKLSNDFSFNPNPQHTAQNKPVQAPAIPKSYEIIKVQPISNFALIGYLNSRGIHNHFNKLREVKYLMNDKPYFAIGFKNDSGGWEIRNKYFKGSFGAKDITIVKNRVSSVATDRENARLNIFEGFFDYMSYLEWTTDPDQFDYIILNSTALYQKAIDYIEKSKYEKIALYLDNDKGGNKITNQMRKNIKNSVVEDMRKHYKNHKDVNEYLVSE